MDSYLAIAERVLREARHPLSARQILKLAYARGYVSQRLHGVTQHKTLGARLSEDILERQERSQFFRSAPGRFFLTEFLDDPAIPLAHRTRFVARRRRRQLAQERALALSKRSVSRLVEGSPRPPTDAILRYFQEGRYHYARTSKEASEDDVLTWTFVVIRRGQSVLSYRHGHYREHHDSFTHKQSVGFFSPVTERDRTLFDLEDHGVVANGLRTISMDLGLSHVELRASTELARLEQFLVVEADHATSLLGVVSMEAPEWLEPYARRLAINELRWLDLDSPINNVDDFDPWSRMVLMFEGGESSPGKVHGR